MDERSTYSFHFLSDLTPRPWRPESSNALRPLGLFVGQGANAIEVVVANLYGLHEHQLVHIFQTFHKGWDYHSRLDGVLRHFRAWSNRS